MKNIIVDNEWIDATSDLLRKWENICRKRKKAHYKTTKTYSWKNKLLSIPIILISTIMGSLSFIHPSLLDQCDIPNQSRLLSERKLQTIIPTTSPTSDCFWKKHDENDFIVDAPYCDNSIIKYNDDYYKSTLYAVDELVCDRYVNFVDNTAYNQFPVSVDITTQSEAEAWCVERDEGYGIFYQKWVDGQIICMVLAESPNNIVFHGQHIFGGVCLSSGLLNNPTETYILQCGDNPLAIDIYNGNCSLIPECALACPGILGGYDMQTSGFHDCPCCYTQWVGCSWGECSILVNSSGAGDGSNTQACMQACMQGSGSCSCSCSSSSYPPSSPSPPPSTPSDAPTITPSDTPTNFPSNTPTNVPSNVPTNFPSNVPTNFPSNVPTNFPSSAPTNIPSYAPTHFPSNAPTNTPTFAPTYTSTSSDSDMSSSFTYIIGGFNMFIAILSALHTFLKYDALEDRHHQYSKHFAALQLDIETLLCKPESRRGNATIIVENYKTKFSVLMNNAPDLPETLEQKCMDDSPRGTAPREIQLT